MLKKSEKKIFDCLFIILDEPEEEDEESNHAPSVTSNKMEEDPEEASIGNFQPCFTQHIVKITTLIVFFFFFFFFLIFRNENSKIF